MPRDRRRCHTRHHEILVQPDVAVSFPELIRQLDQPLADSSFVVTYLLARLARESCGRTFRGQATRFSEAIVAILDPGSGVLPLGAVTGSQHGQHQPSHA
jgi:hypothetical protein